MRIPPSEVRYRKKIGKIGDRSVFQVGCVGGLHVVAAASGNGDFEILGAGSHPGLARHLAASRHEGIEFSDLEKSESINPEWFSDLIAAYGEITAQLRKAQGY